MFDKFKSALSKIGKAMGTAADGLRKLAGIKTGTEYPRPLGPAETFDVDPLRPRKRTVRERIPASAFTKKGPGVRAKLRAALVSMSVEDRMTARARGWDRGLVTAEGKVKP